MCFGARLFDCWRASFSGRAFFLFVVGVAGFLLCCVAFFFLGVGVFFFLVRAFFVFCPCVFFFVCLQENSM